jgi:hypothetical protein
MDIHFNVYKIYVFIPYLSISISDLTIFIMDRIGSDNIHRVGIRYYTIPNSMGALITRIVMKKESNHVQSLKIN